MRWKILLIASTIAAVASTSAILVLALPVYSNPEPSPQRLAIAGATLIALTSTTLACIFVYRHTPRRRKLQAALTVLFTGVLVIIALLIASLLSPKN
ncbi:MAG: hypothetical protein WKF84_12230 [Pyrinomonadaceae bacterium]